MTKTESIKAISSVTGMGPKEATAFLEAVGKLAERTVRKMDSIILPGLGKLWAKRRAARVGRNPRTGEKLQIPAKKVVKFTVSKDIKQAVKSTRST